MDTQGLGHQMCVPKVVNLDLGTPKHLKHSENGHSRKLVNPMLDVLVSAIFGDLNISMYIIYIYIDRNYRFSMETRILANNF